MGQIVKSRVREVIQLHTEAKTYANASKQAAELALKSAWLCGQKLNEIRADLPHGSWERWCKDCIPELSNVTVWRYRKLATEFPELPDLNKAGSIRQAYLQLGIVADSSDSPANTNDTIKLKGSSNVLSYVNALAKWLNEEESKQPFTARNAKELNKLKRDFKPIYEGLRQLYEDPRGKESLSRTA
jgi:hypothetical protein